MDEAPRTLTAARLGALEDLGAVVVALLARRRDALRSARQGELTRAVLASVEVAIVVADPRGHLVMFNDTARRWFGDADPTLAPDAHAERYGLLHPDGRTLLSGAETPLQRVLAEGSVDAVDLLARTASGTSAASGARAGGCSPTPVSSSAPSWPCRTSQPTERQESLQAAHEELARYAGQMRALARASRTVATADDPRTAVCEAVRDLTAADAVYLLQTRTGPDGERLVATASVGIEDDSFLVLDPATERALPLTVLAGGQQLFVADVPSHPTPTVACSRARARSPVCAAGPGRRRPSRRGPRRRLAASRRGPPRAPGLDGADAGRGGRAHPGPHGAARAARRGRRARPP